MKKALWLTLLVSTMALAADSERAALEVAIHRWTTAVNARDVATLTATMTEDVELSDNMATVRGREAAIRALLEMAKGGKLGAMSVEITVAGNIAWHEVGLTQSEKNGIVHGRGLALEIWKRVKGEWKLHRRMATGTPSPGVTVTRPSTKEPVLDRQ